MKKQTKYDKQFEEFMKSPVNRCAFEHESAMLEATYTSEKESDKKLIKGIKAGHKDAKKKRGRYV